MEPDEIKLEIYITGLSYEECKAIFTRTILDVETQGGRAGGSVVDLSEYPEEAPDESES